MDYKIIIKFLKGLDKNNNKVWFDAHQKEYQEARTEWISFVEKILVDLSDIDKNFLQQEPKKCIYRINRDMRFSKNKIPYKKNFGAFFVSEGKKSGNAGYYIHIEPNNSFIAAGLYGPEMKQLSKIRHFLETHYKEFEKITNHKTTVKMFGKIQDIRLKRKPNGYDINHKAIESLKLKSYIFIQRIPDETFGDKNFQTKVFQDFKLLQEFVSFLNKALQSQ